MGTRQSSTGQRAPAGTEVSQGQGDSQAQDENSRLRRALIRQTIILSRQDRACPICHKLQRADEYETHLVCCLTKPKVQYNIDTLEENQGECLICYEDLDTGQEIARLQCLCIYHLKCLQDWFKVKEECPKHPED